MMYLNERTGDLVDGRGAEAGLYVDEDGNPVEVTPRGTHITEVGDDRWVFTTGPREVSRRYGDAPAFHDGAFFEGGAFRFVDHGAKNPDVVEDLACDEGRVVWGKNYVRTKDGREGPTVDSIRSKRALANYMRLTGHREKERGEPRVNKLEELRSRVEARKRRREAIRRTKGKN